MIPHAASIADASAERSQSNHFGTLVALPLAGMVGVGRSVLRPQPPDTGSDLSLVAADQVAPDNEQHRESPERYDINEIYSPWCLLTADQAARVRPRSVSALPRGRRLHGRGGHTGRRP